jgi:hypothetical protein
VKPAFPLRAFTNSEACGRKGTDAERSDADQRAARSNSRPLYQSASGPSGLAQGAGGERRKEGRVGCVAHPWHGHELELNLRHRYPAATIGRRELG